MKRYDLEIRTHEFEHFDVPPRAVSSPAPLRGSLAGVCVGGNASGILMPHFG